jgi:hypothetical protein
MSEHKLKRTKSECAYCGSVADVTADHVPPRSWFPPKVDYALITVPACSRCNQGWAADAEYMRSVLIVDHRNEANESARQLLTKFIRGFARHKRSGPTADIISTLRETEIRSPAGLILGTTGAFAPNIDKLERVCGQIVRGLYWSITKTRLPDSHGVAVHIVAAFTPRDTEHRELIERLIESGMGGNPRQLGDVFAFDHRLIEPGTSAWVMQLYGGFAAAASTLKKSDVLPHRQFW